MPNAGTFGSHVKSGGSPRTRICARSSKRCSAEVSGITALPFEGAALGGKANAKLVNELLRQKLG